MSEFVICSEEHGVLEIELRRRDKRNALNVGMYAAMSAALVGANRSESIRVVLVRGQNDMFCAGNDLADFIDPGGGGTAPALALMDAVSQLEKPLLAAVGGVAVGLGTTLLYHCDAVYATPRARFGMPFVRLGVCPEFGATRLAPQYGGYMRAADAMLFGEPFDTTTACALGLVSQVVEEDQLIAWTQARARKLAALPKHAVVTTKRLMREHGAAAELPAVFRAELEEFNAMLRSEEAASAIEAFLRPSR